MNSSGSTSNTTNSVKIQWGYCSVNPIAQVMEYFYKQRKKHG